MAHQTDSSFFMPDYVVGGYCLPFDKVPALMKKLKIDDRGQDLTDSEYPINNFLAEQGKTDILAGSIPHPASEGKLEDGMLFMTRFIEIHGRIEDPQIKILERDVDKAAKNWLIQACGVEANDLEWMALQDTYNLTRNGIRPEKNNGPVKRHRVFLTDEQMLAFANGEKTFEEITAEGRITIGKQVIDHSRAPEL